MNTYMLSLVDIVTQEHLLLFIRNEEELAEVINKKPDHHVISSLQNMGPVEDGNDYLKRIKEEERNK